MFVPIRNVKPGDYVRMTDIYGGTVMVKAMSVDVKDKWGAVEIKCSPGQRIEVFSDCALIVWNDEDKCWDTTVPADWENDPNIYPVPINARNDK